MRITVRGWGRDMGEKELIKCDLTDVSVSEDTTVYRDKPPTIFAPLRGIYISWYQKFQLMGSYRVDTFFSRAEVLRLFKAQFGTELHASLIERYGFTISDDLKKAVLKTVKLTDLTLGELAAMSATQDEESEKTEDSAQPTKVTPFLRKV